MSARPRPITATVRTASSRRQPTGLRRSYSSDSSGSTESLISVLDHDSYSDSSVYSDGEKDEKKVHAVDDGRHGTVFERLQADEKFRALRSESTDSESRTRSSNTKSKDKENKRTAWEDWLVEKVKKERERLKRERLKLKRLSLEKQKKEDETKEKLKKAEENREKWISEKDYEIQIRRKMERQKKKAEEEIKAEEKARTEQKSKEVFQEWFEMKKQQKLEERRKAKEEKERKKREEEEKRQQSQQAFEEWCRRAKRKYKSLNTSFGYTGGKMTGYHDGSSYPVPSFINPIPWQPVAIPKPKQEQGKSKKKTKPYRWDPNKYY
ncbi:coiled-coil domain-containing protein 34 [Lingula anatina]|uniref:Coiled-coil domain-containing protein 34 n=1 Tax=Lingula anatina TaxID=7574 RepID=A0A1S3K1S5_LINAN|nr:coiled-coil domain-containing protein 34 [Lingula anatina]|eukprot:XP_013416226.1 coiled-coil domain-containing protein 34 [Lingula anatina]